MKKNDILQGTLVLLMLRTLASSKQMHGYAITAHIQPVSGELLRVEEGSLYPALHRMEQDGWVRAEWGMTEKNREARFYSLTARGRKQLPAGRRKLDAAHRGRCARDALRVRRKVWPGIEDCGTSCAPGGCRAIWNANSRSTWPSAPKNCAMPA